MTTYGYEVIRTRSGPMVTYPPAFCPRCDGVQWANPRDSVTGIKLGYYCFECGWPERDRHEMCPTEDGGCHWGQDETCAALGEP